jgi:Protein of unknown function (DUF4232)
VRRTRTTSIAGVVAAVVLVAAVPAALAALHPSRAHAPANCIRNQLGVRSNGINGAAGTIHGAWVFTNLSTRSCRLFGYPGMQLYGRAGRPIPTIVKRSLPPHPTNVTLAPGGSATFFSSYSDIPSGSKPCPRSSVAAITAPNAVASLFIPARLQPCRGIVKVSAVRAGIHSP